MCHWHVQPALGFWPAWVLSFRLSLVCLSTLDNRSSNDDKVIWVWYPSRTCLQVELEIIPFPTWNSITIIIILKPSCNRSKDFLGWTEFYIHKTLLFWKALQFVTYVPAINSSSTVMGKSRSDFEASPDEPFRLQQDATRTMICGVYIGSNSLL